MSSNHTILTMALVIFTAISINLVHFHLFGGGALHHVQEEEFILELDEDDEISYRHENNAFLQIMKRSAHFQDSCHKLPEHHLGEHKPKEFDTGVPPLPEHGVHNAMKTWLENDKNGTSNRGDYPMCSLPPAKSCEVDTFTLILMSHTVSDDERLGKLRNGINNLSRWKNTGEIILVWNSPRSVLAECEKKHCKSIIGWDAEESHPLRIFYSLENGLHNNLLNRYHPTLEPKHDAIVYFDDDGPFHSETAMNAGFELWKFNSDVQMGSMARNIRFPSQRMDALQNEASDIAAHHYKDDAWQTHVHPYDTVNVRAKMEENNLSETGYPEFTPICHEQSGDVVQYNYFVFPHFKAHMSLPSGSILHRNYLCFVWHPAFEELRQFILDHPTHPDDMTISTLVSHLIGKPLRTFPRKIKSPPSNENVEANRRLLETSTAEIDDTDATEDSLRRRRRLLWQQKDWGNMREEAIDSIVGYFGSINPGSVGWCAGTEYQKAAEGKGNMRYDCISSKNPPPLLTQIPWMNEGELGYDECH